VKIGILSDTHGAVAAMKQGMQLLREAGAEFYIHCGDVGSEAVLEQLAGVPAAFVFGNNDWDREELAAYAQKLGITCLGSFGTLELDGKRIAVMHGDDMAAMRKVVGDQAADYLLFGHSHRCEDERAGQVRMINPGALYRATRKTVAVLDTQSDELRYLALG
jgi:putative phosphoesterase